MDRRNFLSGSLVASALSLATTVDSPAQAGSTADTSAPEYMDLRRYHLANGPGVKLTTAFFAEALIPALNRLGIGPVGAFSVYFGPDSPSYYLLMPSSRLETLVTADLELAKDDVFMKSAAPFWDAPASTPPTFASRVPYCGRSRDIPRSLRPPPPQPRENASINFASISRRPTWITSARWRCFIKVSLAFSRRPALREFFTRMHWSGPNLPNLTYMLSFPDMASLEADWEKFSADPDWKQLSADPKFNLDPPTVSNITSLVLHPLACSQV